MTELILPTDTFALLKELEDTGAMTTMSLDLSSRPDLSIEQCTSIAAFLGTVYEMTNWLIGDLVRFAEERHGEAVAQIAEATRRSPQTIENVTSITRRVPASRRRKGVSFSVHAEVAALGPNEQRHWLKVAADENLTKTDVRSRIRAEIEGTEPIERGVCPSCRRPL